MNFADATEGRPVRINERHDLKHLHGREGVLAADAYLGPSGGYATVRIGRQGEWEFEMCHLDELDLLS